MAFGTRLPAALLAAMLACVPVAGCGGSSDAPERDVAAGDLSAEAATVNGQIIYVNDVQLEARVAGLIKEGESLEVDSAEFNEILEKLIEHKLMAIEAVQRGLDEDPLARHRLEFVRDAILQNILLEQIAEEEMDETAIRKMYEAQVSMLQLDDEMHVRHILAPTKDAIDKIAAELKAGADFVVLAAKRSSDEATRLDGGDLGYMTVDQATPEFGRVIRDLADGGVSKPFEDQMGWHIVKIDDRRKEQPPSIDQLRGPIVAYMRRQQIDKVLQQLRADADIVKRTSPRNSKLDAPDQTPRATPPPAPAPAAAPSIPPAFEAQAPAGAPDTRDAAPATPPPAATTPPKPPASTAPAPAPAGAANETRSQ